MHSKAERKAAREAVAAYHETQLGELVRRVGEGIDRFRAGDLAAWEADEVLFQYSRAAKELCNIPDPVSTACVIAEQAPDDWWERGAPRRR